MRREGRAEPEPIHGILYSSAIIQGSMAHLCNDALQQHSRVSIYATCGHGSGCLTSCLLLSLHSISIHRLTASTNRLQLQVDRGGSRRCRGLRREALPRRLSSNSPCMGRYLLHCTCTVLVCLAAGCTNRLLAVPDLSGNLVFSFPGIRERKMTGIPGRPGNGSPGIHTLLRTTAPSDM